MARELKSLTIDPCYHSGLKAEHPDAVPSQRCEFNGGIAFVHDIRSGFPKEFKACDVVYAEPPWYVGFKEFNRRAGVEAGTFEELYGHIGKAVMAATMPVFMTCGDAGLRYLPEPTGRVPIKLYGNPAWLLSYWAACPVAGKKRLTNQEVIAWLAEQYNCVGDFCCGYGVTGRGFVQAGKQCVLTDYNAKCIGEIARIANDWSA